MDIIQEAKALIATKEFNVFYHVGNGININPEKVLSRLVDRLEFSEEVSEDISQYILGHLKVMYPEQYKLFTPSMKKSLKGCIANSWNFHINQLPPVGDKL